MADFRISRMAIWRLLVEKCARLKGWLLSIVDVYSNYYRWLITFALLAFMFGSLAYRFHNEQFWFHICLELSVSMLMLLITVVLVERILEYRRAREQKQRWALVRQDTLSFYNTILYQIVQESAMVFLDKPDLLTDSSDSYKTVEYELKEQYATLAQTDDGQVLKAWAQKIIDWHDTLTPVFNMLRTVVVPPILHSSANRTLVRCVLVTQGLINGSEVSLVLLRREPLFSAPCLERIAAIVATCVTDKYYLEQAELYAKDIDDLAKY